MRYLHTMLRVRDLDRALDFYFNALGLKETRRRVDEKNRYTLVFLTAPEDDSLVGDSKRKGRDAPQVELTYNWDSEDYGEARYFGHLAYEVDNIYEACERLMKAGVTINRPPRDGTMAFVRSPDKHSIELLAEGRRAAAAANPGNRCPTPAIGIHNGPASPWAIDCPPAQTSLYVAALRTRPSSSGPGRRPFTAETRVRVP